MGKLKEFLNQNIQKAHREETGQSLVLIALALVGVIAFVGLAIDVGFIFARGSQLQAAIDSAALAGVVEMSAGNTATTRASAVTKSAQFLNANGMPLSVTESITRTGYTAFDKTELGVMEYDLTATWPVETFFLKALGFRDRINLTRSATAAIYSVADLYASRRVEEGILGTSNQSVFGPQICTNFGDPYSPFGSAFGEQDPYSYRYRILVPPDYPTNILRVELFDPDSINRPNNSATVVRTQLAQDQGLSATADLPCTDEEGNLVTDRRDVCLIDTEEAPDGNPVGGVTIDQVNPFWFLRVDENRGTNTAGACGQPGSYDERYNTRTEFKLYYYRENADGTVQKTEIASYTGQDGTEGVDHQTDLHWVSPGAPVPFGPDKTGVSVPVDSNPSDSTKNFEIELNREVPGILTEEGTGNKYIYLDVTALSGGSENGFEIWAGPNYAELGVYVNDANDLVPSNVNARNLKALNDPGSHSSEGATVLAMGNLPMNSNAAYTVDIPLLYIPPEFAGSSVFISLFDTDSGARVPITFYFDSIAEEDFSYVFQDGGTDPDGVPSANRCQINGGGCNNKWIDPPFEIKVPGNTDECNYADAANDDDCVPFYGGRLTARYQGGYGDTYGWQITITGLPYLIK